MSDPQACELESRQVPPGPSGGPGGTATLPAPCPAVTRGAAATGDLVFAAVALVVLMLASLVRRASDAVDAEASLRSGWEVHGVSPALIDVNRASGDELAALPGVGPVLAGRIAACRSDGPYQRLDDLGRVPGVGPSVLARMAPYVVFLDGDP